MKQRIRNIVVTVFVLAVYAPLHGQEGRAFEYEHLIHNRVHRHLDATSRYDWYSSLNPQLFVAADTTANLLYFDFWSYQNGLTKSNLDPDENPFPALFSEFALSYVIQSQDFQSLADKFGGGGVRSEDLGVFFLYAGFPLGIRGNIGGGVYVSTNIFSNEDEFGNELDPGESLDYRVDRREAVLTGITRLSLRPFDIRYEWNIYGDQAGKVRLHSDFLDRGPLYAVPYMAIRQLIQGEPSSENQFSLGLEEFSFSVTPRLLFHLPFDLTWGDEFTARAIPQVELPVISKADEYHALFIRALVSTDADIGFSAEYRLRFTEETVDPTEVRGSEYGLSLYAAWNDTELVPFSEMQGHPVIGVRFFYTFAGIYREDQETRNGTLAGRYE